jgi:hypothetical protein
MIKQVLIKREDVDKAIRSFLKESDISSIDMIKKLCKAVSYYISKYEIDFENDFIDVANTNVYLASELAKPLKLIHTIQDIALKNEETK